jgi:hypothetical protein
MAAKNYDEIKKMTAKATGASEADVVKAQLKTATKADGFVDLKKSKAELADEKKANKASCCIGPSGSSDKYPYGLTLRLEEDSLEKLGIDDDNLPSAGDELTFTIKARVTDVSSRERADGDDTCCVELQVTKMKKG